MKLYVLGLIILALLFSIPHKIYANTSFGPSVRVDDTGMLLSPQNHPSVAIGASGTIYVVWDDDRNNSTPDIYFSKSTDGGLTFSPNVRVNDMSASALSHKHPFIVLDQAENLYIVWDDGRERHYDVYFTKSTDKGGTFSPSVKVNGPGFSYLYREYAQIALGPQGQIYVVWHDTKMDSSLAHIYFAQSTNGGLNFGPSMLVDSLGNPSNSQFYPKLNIAKDGTIYISGQDVTMLGSDEDIYLTKSTDGGTSFVLVSRINPASRTEHKESLTILSWLNHEIYAVWTESEDIYFSKSKDDGLHFTEPQTIDDYPHTLTQYWPVATIDSKGNIYVAWESKRDGHFKIYFTKSLDGGQTWEPNLRVDDAGSSPTERGYPAITVDDAQNVYAVWNDQRRGGDLDLYFGKGSIPLSPYDQWKLKYFTAAQQADPRVSGVNASPAGDGVINLYKYAMNLNPLTYYKNPYQYYLLNNHFTLQYTLNIHATDVTIQALAKGDLLGGWSGSMFFYNSQPLNADTQTITATDSVDVTTVPMRFFELSVVQKGGTTVIQGLSSGPSINSYYSISSTIKGQGSVTPERINVLAGSTQILTIIPQTGYSVGQILDNGQHITLSNSAYLLKNVRTIHNIVVNFLPIKQVKMDPNSTNRT